MKVNLTKANLAALERAKNGLTGELRQMSKTPETLPYRREAKKTIEGLNNILEKHAIRKTKSY